MLFVRKDPHTKYLCAIMLCQKTYLAKRILPLYARVMDFFDTEEGKHHQRAMENLYNLEAFFKAVNNHEKNY